MTKPMASVAARKQSKQCKCEIFAVTCLVCQCYHINSQVPSADPEQCNLNKKKLTFKPATNLLFFSGHELAVAHVWNRVGLSRLESVRYPQTPPTKL